MARKRRTTFGSVDLKTMSVNGMSCDIQVSPDGVFSSRVAGTRLTAPTLEELEKQLRSLTRKQKVTVAVPATLLGRCYIEPQYQRPHWVYGDGVQHVTLYGLDVDGDAKIRDDKTGEKVRDYQRMVRRLTDAEAAEYTRLYRAKDAAQSAMYEFEQRVKLPESASDLVREAINAKIDTPDEPPEEPDDPR